MEYYMGNKRKKKLQTQVGKYLKGPFPGESSS